MSHSEQVVHETVEQEPGEPTQSDGINIAQVAMIGSFLALCLFVLVLFLQAWYYHADEAERCAKTVRQDDPNTPYGAMLQEQQAILATGDAVDDKGKMHHGLPIDVAMKMIVDNPKVLSRPLNAAGGK